MGLWRQDIKYDLVSRERECLVERVRWSIGMTAIIVIRAAVITSKRHTSAPKLREGQWCCSCCEWQVDAEDGASLMGWRQGIPFSMCYEMGCLHTVLTAALPLLWRVRPVTKSEPSEREGRQYSLWYKVACLLD